MSQTRFSRSIRRISTIGATALILSCFTGMAAYGEEGLEGVIRDGATREAMEALARNEAPIRNAALLVSTRPDLVVQAEGIRSWTSRAFEQILDEQPEEARDDLWQLVRYPALVDAMVEPGAQGRLEEVVAAHPADVRAAALSAAQNSWDAVLRIHSLQRETDDAVNEILDRLDPELANALGLLIDEPAALSVLAENLNLTVALGEAYEDDPETVQAELSQLAADVALADQTERSEWAQQLENDPSLRTEVDEASETWHEEYGADYDDDRSIPTLHHVQPYPYWYGYPHHAANFYVPAAHAHTLWYPRSYWGHSGYYYGAGRTLVVFSAPSFPFLHWLRDRHPHHRLHSSHFRFGRLRHLGHWNGYRQRRHHAHHYRQYRPSRSATHARAQRAHHRTASRRHNGFRPDRSWRGREDRRSRHSLGRGEVRRQGDRDRDRRRRDAREHRGQRAEKKAHQRRDADRRGKREQQARRNETRPDERGAGQRKVRGARGEKARKAERRKARGDSKRAKRTQETKRRVATREKKAVQTRQRRAQQRESARTGRSAEDANRQQNARTRPAPKREKPRAQRSRGNARARAVSPRPGKAERQQAKQKKARRAEPARRAKKKPAAKKAEPEPRQQAKARSGNSLGRAVAPNFGRAKPARAQHARQSKSSRGNQRAQAGRRNGGRSERKRR